MISRRVFARQASSFVLASSLFPMASIAPARAEPITIAIAIAATVAGMIAAHNRGSGGIPDYLRAIQQAQGIQIKQLATLQTAMAMVLDKLADLRSTIDASLQARDIRNLHDLCFSVFESYRKLRLVRSNYSNDDQFRSAPGVAIDINSLLERLESAVSQLKAKKAFGPTTALVIPSAFFLENSLLLLRGDRPKDIASRLKGSVEWLDYVNDETVTDSTSSYRSAAIKRHNTLLAAAQENKFGKALGMKPGDGLFECVGINDFEPEHDVVIFDCGPHPRFNSIRPDGAEIQRASFEMARMCRGTARARTGAHERMFQNIRLTEDYMKVSVLVDGIQQEKEAGFKTFQLSKLPVSAPLPENHTALPAACAIATLNMAQAPRRKEWMETRLRDQSPNQPDYQSLGTLLDGINLERARIAFATQSLVVASNAKREMIEIIVELER